jgi:hypothetical protein
MAFNIYIIFVCIFIVRRDVQFTGCNISQWLDFFGDNVQHFNNLHFLIFINPIQP